MQEFRFLGFALQLEERALRRPDGSTLELTPRLFEALRFLLEHPGQVLEKERLLAELWPGLVVEENSLSQAISALRRALDDDAQQPRFIQTVPRRGFRFVASVELVEMPAAGSTPVVATASHTPAVAASVFAEPAASGPPSQAADEDVDRPPSRRLWLAGVTSAVLVATAGASAWRWYATRSEKVERSLQTLAVLPFKPVFPTATDEPLEVGMAESLVARLSNLPGVAVRSASSVRRFRGTDQDPVDAARELNVAWIVDGSVQRVEGRVRVTARLLNTISGEAAWSGSFDEEYTGVFALQDSISTKVAQVLAPHLERDDRLRLTGAGGTRQVDAYQLYLVARQSAQSIQTAGLLKSIDLYRQAIALDGSYALAWSGLAESYRRMVFGADGEPRVVLGEAARAIDRAVNLDPGSAEAHAGVGWNRFWHDWDWAGAHASFARALALNASESNAHFGLSLLLEAQGRDAEALGHLRQARESDPLSLILLTLESGSLLGAGRALEGRQRLQRVFDISPNFWVAYMVLSLYQMHEGKTDEGLESLAQADRLADGSTQAAAALGNALARKNHPDRARAILERLKETAKSRYVPPTSMGVIEAALGDKEAAIAALQKGFAVRDVRMTVVWNDGRWKSVSGDARYLALRAQMNLS